MINTGQVRIEAAEHLRTLLAAIEAGELHCSTATRHRIEGAVLALDVMESTVSVNDRL